MSAPTWAAVVPAAGAGARAGFDKVMADVDGQPALTRVLRVLAAAGLPEAYVGVRRGSAAEVRAGVLGAGMARMPAVVLVEGGESRQATVRRCLEAVPPAATHVLVHDAARPYVTVDLVRRVQAAAESSGAACAALPVPDTLHRAGSDGCIAATLDRTALWRAQTPQAFRRDLLERAHGAALTATDDAGLCAAAGFPVRLVLGERTNVKLTYPEDRPDPGPPLAVGHGYDVHRLVPHRPLVLGGVRVPFERGLDGHSDADVLCHALCDAVLGAAGLGDIGRHFPPDDPAFDGADSLALLRRSVELAAGAGWRPVQADCLVVAQRPRLAPHVPAMCARLRQTLGCERVNVKAGTNEGLDALGRGEGIAAHAMVLLWRSTPAD